MLTQVVVSAALLFAVSGFYVEYNLTLQAATTGDKLIYKQNKLSTLFRTIYQVDTTNVYFTLGSQYSIEDNRDNYNEESAVEDFLILYKQGMLSKGNIFSIFDEKLRKEAIALFNLFFYAKNFEIFLNTALWARVYINEEIFVYALTAAVFHREDTKGIILPPIYEVLPWYFLGNEVLGKLYREGLQGEVQDKALAESFGIKFEHNVLSVYNNYSELYSSCDDEKKISYFTEDLGLNSYYYYFQMFYPFWINKSKLGPINGSRRGEIYYYFHQQLLARYNIERLSNNMNSIPKFSWRKPVATEYFPSLQYFNMFHFPQRQKFYNIHNDETFESLKFVEDFEKEFRRHINLGFIKMRGKTVDLSLPESIEDLGNYWQQNGDFYNEEQAVRKYEKKFYDKIYRVLLGASSYSYKKSTVGPSVLEQYQTSLRDPVFWQFNSRFIKYIQEYKNNLKPYTKYELSFPGVNIENVDINELVTKFSNFKFDVKNVLYYKRQHLKHLPFKVFVLQPRLNHGDIKLNITLITNKDTDAMIKIFYAPKYNFQGKLLNIDDRKYSFFEIDHFSTKLSVGINYISRYSNEFNRFSEDINLYREKIEIKKNFTVQMFPSGFPNRLILPKGTEQGFPIQFFIMAYPKNSVEFNGKQKSPLSQEFDQYKCLGYPLDRKIEEEFSLPNMYFKNAYVYHIN